MACHRNFCTDSLLTKYWPDFLWVLIWLKMLLLFFLIILRGQPAMFKSYFWLCAYLVQWCSRNHMWYSGIKPGLSAYKANSFLTVLFLWSLNVHFIISYYMSGPMHVSVSLAFLVVFCAHLEISRHIQNQKGLKSVHFLWVKQNLISNKNWSSGSCHRNQRGLTDTTKKPKLKI